MLGLIGINNTNITNVLNRSMNVFNAWLPAIGDGLLLPTKQTTAGEWLMSVVNAVLVTTDGTPGSTMVKGVMKAILDLLTKLLDVQTGVLTYVETAAVNLQSTILSLVNNDTFFDNWIEKRINGTINLLQMFQTHGTCIHYTSPLADIFNEILPLGGGWSRLLCSNTTFLGSVLQTVMKPVMDQVMSLKNILNKTNVQDLTDSAVLSSGEALNTSSVNFMAAVNGVIQTLGMGYWSVWATDSTAKTANWTERMLTLADLLGSKLQEQAQWPQMRTFFDAVYWIMNGLQTNNSGPPMCVFTNSTVFLTCNVTYSWRQFTTLALTILQTSPKHPDSLLWVLQDGLRFIKSAYITQLKQNVTQAQNPALQSLLDSVLKLVEANTNLVSSMTSFNQFDRGVAGTVLKSLLESFNLTPLESLWNGGGLNVSNIINILSQVMTNNQQFIAGVPGINETKFLVTELDPLIEQWLASNYSSSLSFTIGQQLLSLIMSLNQSDPTVLNQVLQPFIPIGLNIPNAIQLALQAIQQFTQVIQGPNDSLNILSGYLNQIQNFLISQGGLDVLLQALNPYWQSNDSIALIHQYGLQQVALGELPFLFISYVKNASSFQTPESVLKSFIGYLPQDQQAELEQMFNSTDELLAVVSLCRTNNFSCIPAFSEITNVLLTVGQVLHASNGSGLPIFWNNSTFALGLREISNLNLTSDVLSMILSWGNITADPVPASMLYETVMQAFDFLKEVGNTSNITSSVCQQLLEKSQLNLTRVNGILHVLTSCNMTNLFNKLNAIVGIQDCCQRQPNKSLSCALEIATNLMGALQETNLSNVIERKILAAEIILQYWTGILNESTTMMKPLEAIYDSTVQALQDGSVLKVTGNAVTLISDSLIIIKSNMLQLGNMSSPQLDVGIQVLDELVQRFLNGTNENGTTSLGMSADYDMEKVTMCLQVTEWYVQMLENLTVHGIPTGNLYPFFRISQMALASALSNAGLSANLASAINASRGYLQGVQTPFDMAGLVNVTQFLVRGIILEAQPYLEQIQNYIQSVEPAPSSFLSPPFQGSLNQTQKDLLDSLSTLFVPLGTTSDLSAVFDSFREVVAFLEAAHQNVTAPLFGLFSADNVTAQVVFSLMHSWSQVPLEGSFTREEFQMFYTYYVEFYQLVESDRWNMSDLEPKLSEFLYQWSEVLLNSSTNSSWVGTNCSALHFIQCMIDNTATGHTQNAILAASGCVSNGTNPKTTEKYEALAYGFLNLSYEMNQKYENDSLGIIQDALPCIVTLLSLSTGVLAKLSDATDMKNTWMEELHAKMKQDLEQTPHFAFCKDLDNRSMLVFNHILSATPDQLNVFLHLLQNQSLFSSSLSSVMPALNLLISRMDSSELMDQLNAILTALTTSEGNPFSQLQHLLLSSTLDGAFNGSREGFQILEQIFQLPWNGTNMKNRTSLFLSFIDILQQENGTLALQSLTAVQSFLNEVNSSGLLQFLSSWGDSQNQRNNGTGLLNVIAVLRNITQAWLEENQFAALLLESLQSNQSEPNALTQNEVLNSLAGFLWPLLPADMQPYANITMQVLEILWPVMADISGGDSPNFYTTADLLLNLSRTITENFAGMTHETMFSDLLDVLEVIVQLASSSLDRNISMVESLTNKMLHHLEVLVNATLPEDVASTMVQVLESARIYSEVLSEFNPTENWMQRLQWIFSFLLPYSNSSSYDFTSVMSLLNQSGGNFSSFEENVKLLRILLDLLPENNTAGAALSLMQNVTKYLTSGNQGNASPLVDAYYLLKLILEHGDILQNESIVEMLLDSQGLSPWSGVPSDVHAQLQWMITDAVKMLITEKCPWLKEYNITNEYVNSWVSASFNQANGSASSDPWETLLLGVLSFISQNISISHPSTAGQLLSSEAQLLLNASVNLLTQGSMNTSQLWKERLDLILQNLLGNTSGSSMDQVASGDVYKLVDGALIEQVMHAAATELLGLNIVGSSSPMYGLLSWFIDTNDTTLVLMRAMEFVTWWNSVKDTDMEFVVQAVQKAYNLVKAVLLTLPQVDFTLPPYVLSHGDIALSALDTLVNFTELNNSTGVTFITSLATKFKNYIENDPTLQTVLPMAQQMLNISRLWHGDSGSFIQLLSSLSGVLTESSVNLTNNSIPLLFTDLVTTFSQPEKTNQILSALKAVEDCQMIPENCSQIISQVYQLVLLMHNTSQNGTALLDALNSIPSQQAHLLSYVNLTESLIFAILPPQDPAPQIKFLSDIFATIRNFLVDPSSSANEIPVMINFTMSINEFSQTLPPLEQLMTFMRSIESALRQEQCNVSDSSDLVRCIYETCESAQEILQLFNATTNSGEIIDIVQPMVEFWITKMNKNETAVSGELQEAVNFTMMVFQNQFSINNLMNNIVSSLQQVKDDLVRWNVTSNQTAETLQVVEGLLQLLEKDSGYLVSAFNRSALQSDEVEVLIAKLSLLETEFMLLKDVSSLFGGSTTHNQYSTIVDFITASLLVDKQLPLSVISPLTSLLNLSKNFMVSGNVNNSFDLSAFILESIISSLNLPVLQNQTLTEENFLFVLSFLNFIQSELKVNASTLILQILSNDIEPLRALNELVALFGSLPSENQLGLIADVFHLNTGSFLTSLRALKDEIGLILGLHATGNLDMETILNFFNSSMKIVQNELSMANISGSEVVGKSLSDLLYFLSQSMSIYQLPGGPINPCSISAIWHDLFETVNITLPSGYLQTCQGFEDLATSILNLYNKILQMTQSTGDMTDVFLDAVSVADQFITLVQAESNLLQTDIPVIPVLHQVFVDIINSVQTSNSTSSVDASVPSPITPDEQDVLLSAITTLNTLLQAYTNTSTATSPYVEVSSIVEDLLMSQPASLSPYINALDKIMASFSLLLTEQQMSNIYPSDQIIKALIAFLNCSDSPANLANITDMTADSFHSLLGSLENFTLPNGLKITDVNQLIGNISMVLADSLPMVLNTSGLSGPNDQNVNNVINQLVNNISMVLADSLPKLLNTSGPSDSNDQKINNLLNQLGNNISMVLSGSLPMLLNTSGPSGPNDQKINNLLNHLINNLTMMLTDSLPVLLNTLGLIGPNDQKINNVINQLVNNISMVLADSLPKLLNTSGPSGPNDQRISDLLNHLINNLTMMLTDSLPVLLNTLGLFGPNDQKINNALNQLVNNITMVVVGSLPQLLNSNGPSGPNDQKINDLLNQIINNITMVLAETLPMVTNTSRLFDPNAIQLSAMLRSFIQNKLTSNSALLNFSGTIQELDNLISTVVALVGMEQSHYLNVTYEIVRNLVLSVYSSKNSMTAADILNAMSGSFASLLGIIPNKTTPQAVSTIFNNTVVFVRNLQDLLNKTRLIKAVKMTSLVVGELQNVLGIFSPSYALKNTSNVLQMLKSNLESAPLSNSSDWISETFQILASVIKLIPFQNSSTSLLTNVTLSLANATQDKVLWESLGMDLTKLFTESGNGTASAKLKQKVAVTQDLRSVVCRIEQLPSVQQLYQMASFTPGLVCQTFLPAIVSLLSLSNSLVSKWMQSPPNSDSVQAYFLSGINNFELQLNWFNGILNTTQSINWTSLSNFVNESSSTAMTAVLSDIITTTSVFQNELQNISGISEDVIKNITSMSLPHNITQVLPWILNLTSQEGAQMNATQWYYFTVTLLRYMDFSKLFLKLMLPSQLQMYIDIIIQLLMRFMGIFVNSQPLIDTLQTFITEIQQLSATSLAAQQRDMSASSRAATSSFSSFNTISGALCSYGVISLFAMPNIADNVGSRPSTQSNLSTEQLLQKFDIPNDTTPFCQSLFLNMVSTTGGAVMWAFLKPMLLGKILFTPNIPETWAVMQKSNVTLQDLYQLTTYADMWIGNSSNIQTLVTVLSQIKPLLTFLKNSNVQSFISLESNINIADVLQNAQQLSNFGSVLSANMPLLNQMTTLCKLLKNISSCINFNRYQAMNTTDALNSEATKLLQHNNLYASVIFNITTQKSRQKRSVGSSLPPLVKYTIRMPISNTMRTDRLRDVMWTPGPHISASQYLLNNHGFIYLQEDIEKAIIELQTEKVIDGPAVQIQAFPYPCYTRDNFLYSMSYSFPLIVMLAWILFIAAFVKKLVQERELRLHEYMKMMGVNPFSHFFAWFIESASFLLITIIFLVIILKAGSILPQTNGFLIFLFFCDYGLSILSMSFLFSTFFSHTNIASLSGSLIYVILFFPFIVMTSLDSGLTFTTKSLLGLFAPTCFSYASQYIIYYETQGTGMQWGNSYQSPVINDNASFGWFCWLLLIDSSIYFIIGCYIRMVFPGKYGIAAPWYFPVLPSFWTSCLPCFKPESNGRSGLLFMNVMMHSQMADPKSKGTDNVFFEGEEDLDGLTVGVSLHGLTKMYGKSAALQNLNLRFYEDQVTSLLGHNGAGKTTTMSLLTGLYGPTSGSVLIYGKDTRFQMDAVRQSLGVCMQYDVLFDHLTAKEHLFLYAQIKAPQWSKEEVRHQVRKILKDTAMYTHRHKRVGALSGGTKRKLSIAIAFLGGSKTVVLDEPTTGVDPCSRRSIWNIVNMYKKERTIILSTHHLDEAEVLSDRIAFLERGGLKCCGSPLYLKQKLGIGYKLSLSKKIPEPGSEDQCDVNRVTEFIKSHFREAELKETVGSDMVYSLPTFGVQYAPYYQALLRGLDENLENLQLGSYGISDTTLEEVFLQLTKDEAEDDMSWSNTQMVVPVPFVNQVVEERSVNNYNISETEALKGNSSVTGISLLGQKILAVLVKRLQHSLRDWKGLFAQLLLPVLFVIAAMGLATIKTGVQTYPALELMPSMYGTTKQTTFFGIQNSSAYPLVSTMMSFPA
uniref:Uncharacterized LOC114656398 n=1 Tax=Erpetoichthys calabaricus TaxID=27687 RepID=A0A8C4SSP8_ERPCA